MNKVFDKSLIAVAVLSCGLMLNGCAAVLVGAAAGGTGAVIGSDSRTVDVQMYDEQIENDCKRILTDHRSDSNSKIFNVDVVAVNGNVLVAGQTENQSYLQQCIEQMKQVQYVRNVYNYVENRAPISASEKSSDAWITSKVKSQLLFGKKISSGRFKVFTENKVVYLMGYVTRDEAARAVNQVKNNVSGISKVVTIFDYMDSVNSPDPVVEQRAKSSTTNSSSSMAAESQSSVDNGGATIVSGDDDLLAPAQPANW